MRCLCWLFFWGLAVRRPKWLLTRLCSLDRQSAPTGSPTNTQTPNKIKISKGKAALKEF